MNIFKPIINLLFPFSESFKSQEAEVVEERLVAAKNAERTFLATLQPELPNPYEVRLTAEQAKNLYEFAAAGIRVAQTNPDANTVDEDTVNEMIESVRGPINLLGAIGARVVQ